MPRRSAQAVAVCLVVILIATSRVQGQTATPVPSPEVPRVAIVSAPDSAAAAVDLGKYLNLRTGRWTVNRVNPASAREIYEMDAVVDITVEAGGPPRRSDRANDPWLDQFSGNAGEKKSIPVTLTWVKKEAGWKLRSIKTREAAKAK